MNWIITFYRSTLGKKASMALSGAVLFGFTIGHMAGNLQVFLGPEKLNAYAAFLKDSPGILWGTRTLLLVSVVLHIDCALSLTRLNRAARPEGYAVKRHQSSTYASRTMIWSGPILAAFIIYHLLHFTLGDVHPNFSPTDVYTNMITGFQVPWVSAFYILAMILLCIHLAHGGHSLFQSLGLNHPKYNRLIRTGTTAFAFIVALGNISMPIAVLAGYLKLPG